MHETTAGSVRASHEKIPVLRSLCAIVGCMVHRRARVLVGWPLSLARVSRRPGPCGVHTRFRHAPELAGAHKSVPVVVHL